MAHPLPSFHFGPPLPIPGNPLTTFSVFVYLFPFRALRFSYLFWQFIKTFGAAFVILITIRSTKAKRHLLSRATPLPPIYRPFSPIGAYKSSLPQLARNQFNFHFGFNFNFDMKFARVAGSSMAGKAWNVSPGKKEEGFMWYTRYPKPFTLQKIKRMEPPTCHFHLDFFLGHHHWLWLWNLSW